MSAVLAVPDGPVVVVKEAGAGFIAPPGGVGGVLFRRTGHVCRTCLGPVLAGADGYICAVCDAAGDAPEAICGCGIRVQGSSGGKRALFRCAPNPARGPASPAAAVITFGPGAA